MKGRLILFTLLALTVVWVAAVAYSYLNSRHEIDEMLDGHLAQAASLLSLQAGHELEEIDTEHAPVLHKYARKVAFQVWDDEGKLRVHSLNAPSHPLGSASPGFSEGTVDDRDWRVFTTYDESGKVRIHVAEQVQARQKLARELSLGMLKPFALALPLLALMLWFGIGYGLKPLDAVAAAVAARAPDNLAALATAGMPPELRPVVERLNELLARLARSLDSERRFTADAAHELRTPLAGIRAQAQVAQGARNDDERRRAIDAVVVGCDRATRLVEQLLTLARVEQVPAAAAATVGLRELAVRALTEVAPAAAIKNVDIALDDGAEVCVSGHDGLLQILLRNLLDNAVRYSPPGRSVEVAVDSATGAPRLVVRDHGPGIPDAERTRVFDRFYRVLGSGEEGCGLGLSIVGRIAAIHAAQVRLAAAESGSGLVVEVVFPAA